MKKTVLQLMRRKTKNLPFLKRIAARLINKLQKILIKEESHAALVAYYKLANIHFKLHYGYTLKEAIKYQKIGLGVDAALLLASIRHGKLFLKANPEIIEEGGKTLIVYQDLAEKAFLENIKKYA